MANPTREQAQQRADRIHAFQQELLQLQVDQVVDLSGEQQQAIDRYHRGLLDHFTTHLDIDADQRSRQLSLGMRAASLFGALALATGLFFLFYQFWGLFNEASQVAILLGSALGSVLLTFWIQKRDSSGYYVKLAALLAVVCFVLNLVMLGQIFNITPSDKALVPWGLLSLILAYQCRQRVLLGFGLLCLGVFVAARVNAWGGFYWFSLYERPENFLPVALVVFCVPQLIDHTRFSGFASLYRSLGLLALFIPVLVLSYEGNSSYLPWSSDVVEGVYRFLSFVLAGLATWLGIRRGWPEVVNVSLVFAVIFLYAKLFDWWWELMPKYLFFLLLGTLSLLLLVVLQRWRRQFTGGAR
ncbi:DUF2157 domain-containing protein [Pseudomonas sp. GD03944]|uniref:DUF2157 domain-containing protein n=1 Tax=Pseudomonas sp. GD03944 TaxID=2975409 RepID=UPI00244BF2AF|nr:DUF2157 domain-containing protein [Pseudomonas sp. GD03944]MDH1264553.1 DUF2157 domain-containing protein [Pseudomonas sp. GD03944]